ncbi:hypothetical protein [Polyangium sp. y55x31]|uniref:hypothetical protein n=1 Tax=Polyangium sp. y55x31 TaxID=3042688 RepID=UPI00248242A5|nr:hypothetical protein [Polyangium sp. y55x31]MDI1478229.1 hypothetical protein [Polyangium sp. y55x31]
MSKPSTDFVRWSEVVRSMNVDAEALPQSPVPLHVLFGEAVDVARFFEKYYKTQVGEGGVVLRRGLDSVAGRGKGKGARRIGPKTGKEILSIQRAAQEAQTRYLLTVDTAKPDEDPLERGLFLLGEIKAALTYHFDDGVTDAADAQLARVSAAHEADPRSADAVAAALADHAALAATYEKELDGFGGFSAAYIDEAKKVAAALREKPTRVATSEATRDALLLRNRLVALLLERIGIVRAAARFVFRDRPEIVREATSEYARKRRAEARRTKESPAETAVG